MAKILSGRVAQKIEKLRFLTLERVEIDLKKYIISIYFRNICLQKERETKKSPL